MKINSMHGLQYFSIKGYVMLLSYVSVIKLLMSHYGIDYYALIRSFQYTVWSEYPPVTHTWHTSKLA